MTTSNEEVLLDYTTDVDTTDDDMVDANLLEGQSRTALKYSGADCF